MFASDLHGKPDRYRKLFAAIREEHPSGVFLGGDLLPHAYRSMKSLGLGGGDFVNGFLVPELQKIRTELGASYPQVFLILGNDDCRSEEAAILDAATHGIWHYAHLRELPFGAFRVFGYAYVPPTPFQLKDWERYDVSRYVDPGCVGPEEGRRTVPVAEDEMRYATIAKDLARLVDDNDLADAIFLFHTPPYRSALDRAALDGQLVDSVPLDVHVGSIAVARFIVERQPLVTLHGHVHESTSLTGSWQEQIGRTYAFGAAHHGTELALVRFDPGNPGAATRQLL